VTTRKQVAIYGAGGFAREVAWLLSTLEKCKNYDVLGYIEDGADHGRILNGKPVLSWERFCDLHRESHIAVAVGNPQSRQKLAMKCAEAGFSFATLIHHSVEMSDFVELGTGSIICCGSILTVNITIEQHVHINLDCTIGHDVRIGEFTTLAPGVHVSGRVHIGKFVYVGTGANIINGTTDNPLVIGDGTVIGAGACVIKSTEPNSLYAGVPAEFKKRYTSKAGLEAMKERKR
jgi:sugar O-acyltransferase (sialic acid O-acetyltransferase NeuD family)